MAHRREPITNVRDLMGQRVGSVINYCKSDEGRRGRQPAGAAAVRGAGGAARPRGRSLGSRLRRPPASSFHRGNGPRKGADTEERASCGASGRWVVRTSREKGGRHVRSFTGEKNPKDSSSGAFLHCRCKKTPYLNFRWVYWKSTLTLSTDIWHMGSCKPVSYNFRKWKLRSEIGWEPQAANLDSPVLWHAGSTQNKYLNCRKSHDEKVHTFLALGQSNHETESLRISRFHCYQNQLFLKWWLTKTFSCF